MNLMELRTSKPESDTSGHHQALRERAERLLWKTRADIADMTHEDVQSLVFELQVHQVELELQNETLCETQAELVASRDRYAELYDFAPVGYFTIDNRGKILEANLTAVKTLQVDRDELIGANLSDFIARGSQDAWYLHRHRALTGDSMSTCVLEMRRPDGIPLFARWEFLPVSGASQTKLHAAMSDITAQRLAEESVRERESQLAHISRLSTMGQMVAGIAHEVNQPLYSIVNFGKAAKNALKNPTAENLQRTAEWTSQMTEAAVRAGKIIKRIRGFVSRQETSIVSIDLRELIDASVALLSHEIAPDQILLDIDLPTPCPIVFGDPIQIQQVLVNLLLNAIEAIRQGGSTIRNILVATRVNIEFVEVAVTDTGPGIPPGDVSRLFDPFVTHKSSGMGMGLAVSRTIVESMGGRLWASNHEHGGATFRFTLPTVEQIPPAASG